MTARTLIALLKDTGNEWLDDRAPRLAAALAYYTLLSIAPMLVLAVFVAGLVFGDDAARGHLSAQLEQIVGAQASKGIEAMITQANAPGEGFFSSIIGVSVLFFGASGVFGELQSALDTIWQVEPKPGRGVLGVLRDRFFSFSMVMGVAFLLLVSLVISTLLAAVGQFFSHLLPGGAFVWEAMNFSASVAVVTVLFALIFKVVPDAKVAWRDVWIGALFTSLLFSLGKLALGIYLGRASVASPYGAAGSLIVFVIWVYYAAQILFFGAEFTQVYARHCGASIEPSGNAVRLEAPKVDATPGKASAGTNARPAPL